ncbi:MAG: CHASE domain-containing protein [Pseudomonadota bacterium]
MPILVLMVGVCATALVALQLFSTAVSRDNARLRLEADLAVSALQERLQAHGALLRGAAGLFAASDQVSAPEFTAYVERLGLQIHYPGVLGIGYARLFRGEAAREAVVADMRRQGVADFRVWPEQTRDLYTSIVYLDPLNARNAAAIGYDMFTEPTRREAMQRAMRTGDLALSGAVELVQEIDEEKQPGFLIFLPVGRDDPADAGFVYSPLRAGDLLATVFPRREGRLVDIALYDGSPTARNLLYRTDEPDGARLSTTRQIVVAGRPWTMTVRSRPAFEARSNRDLAWWAVGIGALFTATLTAAVFAQARAGLRAAQARNALAELNASLEDRVLARTRELAAANASLRGEMARREEAENQIRQMQKMEAVGQLTGGIAHDFNNMLAIIVGSLDMAQRRLDDPNSRVGHYIANAAEGARRAAALTNRLLTFARRQRLDPRPVDLSRLVDGMTELLQRSLGERVKVETRLAQDLWPTYADAAGLENAVLNLAVNARDAMPEGGRLTLETLNVPADEGPAAGDQVAIRVADTGVGMPAEVAERAFEPFFTTKDVGRGNGLGLSQVYGFVSQSGGRVTIDSAPDEGTTITIWLPRWRGEASGTEAEEPEGGETPRARPAESVLVVEDEPDVRRFSVEALLDLGYEVREAADGAEALERLAEGARTDLLFTDVVMPGMTGPQLAERARAARPDLKVLYTTGYAREALSGHDRAGGPLLPKPFTVDQLARKVRQALDDQAA